MYKHSVKVPRHYKVAANIFKKAYTEGGSVKTLLYDEKLRHFRTNVLYALVSETIKHAVDIEKIFESCEILTKEPRLDPWLAKILTTELLFGKKTLPGKSKPELTILSYKEQFEKIIPEHQDDLKSEVVRRPRYVRINTNLLATSDAIRVFQDEGYKFIRCTSGTYNDFLQQIQSLTEYDFTQDYHVKTVFVFAPGTKLHEHDLYLENQIILQDKATALAVHLLAPPSGSVVLDMCAAPGMKTTQLAAYLRNQGKIYAVERNENRFKTLCDFVERTGSKCVETMLKDSLEIKRGEFDDVEYILLDPSCSGSGMDLHVHNYIEDTRLARLTSLQEKFLKHAMNSFPNAKRIVYSTCSIFPEENERVITNVVKTSRAKWRVQDVKELIKGQWNNFGSGMYGSMGTRCLYAVPNSDFTTGFFLAVLDRDTKDMEKSKGTGAGDADIKVKEETELITEFKTEETYNNEIMKKIKIEVKEENDFSDIKQYGNNVKEEMKQFHKYTEDTILEIKRESDIPYDNDTKVNKKRKKIKKEILEMSMEGNLSSTEVMSEVKVECSDIEKTKKKKLKIINESTTDLKKDKDYSICQEEVNINERNETNKKNKKRKTIDESRTDIKQEKDKNNSICVLESENINHNTETTKKKNRKTIDETTTDLQQDKDKDYSICQEEENTNENSKTTKKQKKRKIIDELTTDLKQDEHKNYSICQEEGNINEDNETTKKKKKRKTVEECSEDSKINVHVNENAFTTDKDKPLKSKKKKKNKMHAEVTESIEDNYIEKNNSVVQENSDHQMNKKEKGDSSNKKTKNKSIHIENSETVNMNEVSDVPKKKKKRIDL